MNQGNNMAKVTLEHYSPNPKGLGVSNKLNIGKQDSSLDVRQIYDDAEHERAVGQKAVAEARTMKSVGERAVETLKDATGEADSYHLGGRIKKTGTARLKAGERVNGRLVPQDGLYQVKKNQVVTPPQPQKRWNTLGESGRDAQSRLLGWD
jgi:hypothetical protein